VDERLRLLRDCADYLAEDHGGDREAACLEGAAHQALALADEMLAAHGAPRPRGYKDACDKLGEAGLITVDLCERLKKVFDVADRVRLAWSSLEQGALETARRIGGPALREFADIAEQTLAELTPATP
jgi:uncharacterized protein YutE (UPF0331/DUF86 family)